jgi:hypothetical protein
MKNKTGVKSIAVSLISILIVLSSCSAESKRPIANYKECVEAGNVILRSMPPQCVTRDGERFMATDEDKGTKRERKNYCQNLCGDGSCQVLVCQAVGCPCAESPDACPADCKENSE